MTADIRSQEPEKQKYTGFSVINTLILNQGGEYAIKVDASGVSIIANRIYIDPMAYSFLDKCAVVFHVIKFLFKGNL